MTRRGGVTFPTFIPSPTRCTPTVTTSQAPSSSWRAARCAPACMATTQACGASGASGASSNPLTLHPHRSITLSLRPRLELSLLCRWFCFVFLKFRLSFPRLPCVRWCRCPLILRSKPFAHTWTQEHDLNHSHYHCLEYVFVVYFLCVCVCVCVRHHAAPPLLSFLVHSHISSSDFFYEKL